MQVARKVSVLVALGLGFGAAMAGEIADSTVLSTVNVNTSVGFLATARQNIGVAEQNGKIKNSTVIATGSTNTAAIWSNKIVRSSLMDPVWGGTNSAARVDIPARIRSSRCGQRA